MHSRWLPREAGWENAKSVQSCHQGKGWLFKESQIENIYLVCLTLFCLIHDSMCYFIVIFMSSLLFYNVENSKK